MVGHDLKGLTQAWIKDCERSHKLCPRIQDGILPTRVLDVKGGASYDDLRLAVPLAGSKGRWIALSYCWGKIDGTYRTTTQNIDYYKGRIPFEKLPRTIRDAVTVTRSLGVQYLWVDALCIIQDSRADWRAEAPKMMNVYRNACLTIAANIGDNAEAGLGIDRNLLESRPYELRFREQGGTQLTKFRWIHPPRQPWGAIIGSATLQTRGWTMQETHLASRVIYYDQTGLYWQCHEGIRQERLPATLVTANDPAVTRRRIFDAFSDDPRNIFVVWQDLVKDFTSRKLTYQSDKLFAVAGIAAALAAYIRSRLHRRLATPEEEQTYLAPKLPKHWAVPDNPRAIGGQRYDGANSALRWILSMKHDSGVSPRGGPPLSMDIWLGKRFTGQLDPEAERAFAELGPETREIMKSVGMENLLKFVDDTENLDYDNEYIHLMSHPDTHAAYMRAYEVWTKRKGTQEQHDGSISEESCSRHDPRRQDPLETTEQHNDPGGSGQGVAADVDEEEIEDMEEVRRKTQMDISLPEDFRKEVAVTRGGVPMDPDLETEFPAQMAAVYVYGDNDPIKARVEWPAFVSDNTYLAGIWKADVFNQLQWYAAVPGTRPLAYRAPSWSWASIDDAEIYYHESHDYLRGEGGDYNQIPRLLDARVVVEGENWFGDAKSGRLVLLADVAVVEIYDLGGGEGSLTSKDDESESGGEESSKQGSPEALPDGIQLILDELDCQLEVDESESGGEEFPRDGPPEALPGVAQLTLDELDYQLGPNLKMVRLKDSFYLLIEFDTASRDPIVGKRVGCWMRDRNSAAELEAEAETEIWERKTIILI